MKRIFVAAIALGLIVGLNPAAAAGGRGGAMGAHGTGMHGTGTPRMRVPRAEPLHMPDMQSRIPAPLPTPARPPAINGPVGPNGLPPMGNGL
jgi:hypothetical protein